MTAAAVTLCTASASLAIAACGGEDETTSPQSATNLTTTEQTTTDSTTTESTTTEDNGGVEPEPGDDSGGQGGGNTSSGPGSGGSEVPDTPENDVTPPANTPQGQFEMYCNENPGACG